MPKFYGPFKIVKVNDNGVTYELKHCEDDTKLKHHHRKWRRFYKQPKYLLNNEMFKKLCESFLNNGNLDLVCPDVFPELRDYDDSSVIPSDDSYLVNVSNEKLLNDTSESSKQSEFSD